jgi:hypothetical protein
MAAAGYVMKQAGQGQQGGAAGGGLGGDLGGMLGSILGGGQAAPAGRASEPSASSNILGDLIGAAGKYLGR